MAVYRLLRGVHSEGKNKDKSPKIYNPNDEFFSKNDLLKHNLPGQPPRFALVSGDAETSGDSSLQKSDKEPEGRKSLEDMTVAELVRLAKDNDVDLGDAQKKADIIAALQGD